MRYSRNVKIFRGGVDAAPFAGLFFVVVMFMMLFYSHIFFPGVPVKLTDEEGPPEMKRRSARVLSSGEIEFLGQSYSMPALKEEIQARAQKGTLPRRVQFEAEPGAPAGAKEQVENQLKAAGIALKIPGTRLELPDDAGFAGAHNPVVVVGINVNGQIFFQHQLVTEEALQSKLSMAVEKAGEPITLLLQADKSVATDKVVRLSQIASRAGITEMRIATKPSGT
ncbi:MAG TPA: biopolymer transporter ExbD [Verrucomicrobiae bacterium]|nr:biopolymer transporter ExbD [Verrucomicrobiae bacterium]